MSSGGSLPAAVAAQGWGCDGSGGTGRTPDAPPRVGPALSGSSQRQGPGNIRAALGFSPADRQADRAQHGSVSQQRKQQKDPLYWSALRRVGELRTFNQLGEVAQRQILCTGRGALAFGSEVPDWSSADGPTHVRAELLAFNGWVPVSLLAYRFLVEEAAFLRVFEGDTSMQVDSSSRWIVYRGGGGHREERWRTEVQKGIQTGRDQEAHRTLAMLLAHGPQGMYANPPGGYVLWRD